MKPTRNVDSDAFLLNITKFLVFFPKTFKLLEEHCVVLASILQHYSHKICNVEIRRQYATSGDVINVVTSLEI